MARLKFLARALAVSQVERLTVGGTVEVGDLFIMEMNKKVLTVAAESTVLDDVCEQIAEAWNALDDDLYPEFREATAEATGSGNVDLTGLTPGVPFTVTVSTTEGGGGAADLQLFTNVTITDPTGPDWWDEPDNWDANAVPVSGDTVDIDFLDTPIRYGLNQSAVTLLELNITNRFEGEDAYIGLDDWNENGYPEYRVKDLMIGVTTLNIGKGAGEGSGMIRIDKGAVGGHVNVYATGTRRDPRYPSLRLLGTDAGNTLSQYGGDVGIATLIGDSATINNPELYAGSLFVGRGATVTGQLLLVDGEAFFDSNPPSVLKRGGLLVLRGSQDVTTIDNKAGNVVYQSTGNVSTKVTLGPGAGMSVDGLDDAVTVAALEMHTGSIWVDSKLRAPVTTWDLYQCTLQDVTIVLPRHLRITAQAL